MKKQKWFKLVDGKWVLSFGRHHGETLDAVAKSHPSYLQFIFKKKHEELEDAQYYALEDVMTANKIPLFEKRPARLPSKHASRHAPSLR